MNDISYNDKIDIILLEYAKLIGLNKNGGQECDAIDGPCACGAWHSREEWVDKLFKSNCYGF